MKKAVLVLLALCTIYAFAGCSNNTTQHSSTGSSSQESSKDPEPASQSENESKTSEVEQPNQFGDKLDVFQGEWEHIDGSYRLIVNGNEVNSVYYGKIDGVVDEVNTFYFGFDDSGNLVVTNKAKQPRFTLTIDENGLLIETSLLWDDDTDSFKKISDNTVVPKKSEEPSIGMTEQEVVLSTWGPPKKRNKTKTANRTHAQWVYEKGYIYFENGRVTAIQER